MNIFLKTIAETLKEQKKISALRELRECRHEGKYILFGKKKLINLAGNDYLGFGCAALSKEVLAFSKMGGSGLSSRLLAGNHELYTTLEKLVSKWKGFEATLFTTSGYMANLGVVQALAHLKNENRETVLLFDRLVHGSLIDGVRLSSKKFYSFRHNDLNDLEKLLKQHKDKAIIIIVESIYSMDGDRAPLADLAKMSEKYHALLFVDEAHANGIVGKRGSGLTSLLKKEQRNNIIATGTMGKALGGSGAFINCNKKVADYLVNFIRPFIFTTALSPLQLKINIEAIKKLSLSKNPGSSLIKKSLYIKKAIENLGFSCPSDRSAILPIIIGSNEKTLVLQKLFEDRGYYLPAIRPPTVPMQKSRLRIAMNDLLTWDDLESFVKVLQEVLLKRF